MKQKVIDLKEETHKFTSIFGDFNAPLLVLNKTSRWKNRYGLIYKT